MTTLVLLLNVASLLSFWLPAAWLCNVTIHPKEPAVIFGSSVSLNCTASCTNYTALKWEVSFSHEIQEGNGWTSLKINNVTHWNAQPLCIVQNEDLVSTDRAIIYAYEFSTPKIYLTPDIQSGHLEQILCNISSLKVRGSIPSNINISLIRGRDVLSSNSGKSSVKYSFVADLQKDNRAEIRCEVYVNVGSELLRKQTKRILNVVASPFNLNISANRKRYNINENITVTCNAEGKPFPKFSWILPSTEGVTFSNKNQTIEILSAQSSHNGTYLCLVHNIYGKKSAQMDILLEERSRSWIAVVVVVLLLTVVVIAGIFLYRCQK